MPASPRPLTWLPLTSLLFLSACCFSHAFAFSVRPATRGLRQNTFVPGRLAPVGFREQKKRACSALTLTSFEKKADGSVDTHLPQTAEIHNGRKLSLAIIGGGPAGLAAGMLALDLADVGSVTIVEKRPSGDFHDGPATWGIGCGNRAKMVLSAMPGRVLGRLEEAGTVQERLNNHNYSVVNRPIIRECIFNGLTEVYGNSGRLHLEFDNTVSSFDTEGKVLKLANGRTVKYDILLLADGIHSPSVRQINDPSFFLQKSANWKVIKSMPFPALPGREGGGARFRATLRSGGQLELWLMYHKDGSRYLLWFYPGAEGINPNEASTPAELRELLASAAKNPVTGDLLDKIPASELENVLLSVQDDALEEFLSREPKHFWAAEASKVADPQRGIVTLGDAAGSAPVTLGHAAQRALVDAWDFKRCLEDSLALAQGGRLEGRAAVRTVVESALEAYEKDVLPEKKALTALSVLATVSRQHFGDRLWLSDAIYSWVEDPAWRYQDIAKHPLVFPSLVLAKAVWRRISLSEADVMKPDAASEGGGSNSVTK